MVGCLGVATGGGGGGGGGTPPGGNGGAGPPGGGGKLGGVSPCYSGYRSISLYLVPLYHQLLLL